MDSAQAQPARGHARKRRAVACEPCRQSKLRCDRNHPCSNCGRSTNKVCSYLYPQKQSQRRPEGIRPLGTPLQQSAEQIRNTSTARIADARSSSIPGISTANTAPASPVPTPGTWHSSTSLGSVLISGPSHHEAASIRNGDHLGFRERGRTQEPLLGEEQSSEDGLNTFVLSMHRSNHSIRGVMVKGRYVGQTHWLHSAVLFPIAIYWLDQQERKKSKCWQIMQDCKSLARFIKLQWSPQPLTGSCGRSLPMRTLADQLISNYLRTFETVYRVFHVPTFMDEYSRFWSDPNDASDSTTIKIQLCLAIGASFHDHQFSLRTKALQWIHEASSWLTMSENTWFSISGLQIMCLIQLARLNVKAFSGDQVWVSAGTFFRTAISMGLHLDPSILPKMSVFQAEMRRRLWTTIIELSLAASVETGAPPQISCRDFNCQSPSNLDDSQLNADANNIPIPAAPHLFTDTSLQICFGRSFGTRLAIADILNRPPSSPATYEEILKLSTELSLCCRSLADSLCSFGNAVSDFQRRLCEMLTQRYFIILHLSYTPLASTEPLYYFSRKMCVETALKLLYPTLQASLDGDPTLASLHAAIDIGPKCEEFQRLMICGSGPFRSIPFQCIMSIASELLAVLQESRPEPSQFCTASAPPSSAIIRASASNSLRNLELCLLLRAAVSWMESRILAGETNVKDYLFVNILLAHAEALMGALSPSEVMQRRAAEALPHATAILRGMNGSETNCETSVTEEHGQGDIHNLWTNECPELGYEDLLSMMGTIVEEF